MTNESAFPRKRIRYAAWTVAIVNLLLLGAAMLWPGFQRLEDQSECRQAQFVEVILKTATSSEQDCLERRARERASWVH